MTGPRGYPPAPRGYYVLAQSRDLSPGQVRAVRAFGRELALVRTRSGRAQVMDAHCAHLGANLARGGRVCGELLECPFHHWRYDVSGACVEIDGARKIPTKATIPTWPTIERDGLIYLGHQVGPDDRAPAWPGFDAGFRFIGSRTFSVSSHPQELAENCVDFAHFPVLHDSAPPVAEVDFDGEQMRLSFETFPRLLGRTLDFPVGSVHITCYGLTQIIVEVRGRGLPPVAIVQCPLPVDGLDMRVTHVYLVALGRFPGVLVRALLAQLVVLGSILESRRDLPLLAEKIYRPRPVLSETDGPIGRFRRWARQFYPSEDLAPA